MDTIWYNNLKKSSLTPPTQYFSIVWTIIYITIFISLVIIMNTDKKQSKQNSIIYVIFFIKMIFNLLWSYIFFTKKMLFLSFVIILLLDISTIMTIYYFYKINRVAGLILIPNLLWILFATYLNYYIVVNN